MIGSWLPSIRQAAAPLAGALLLGVSGSAQADHDRGVRFVGSAPGFYMVFDTGARRDYRSRHDGYYAPLPRPVYVPGYWTWAPSPGCWRYGYGEHRWKDDHPRHHGKKRGWDRHAKWDDDRRWRDHDD